MKGSSGERQNEALGVISNYSAREWYIPKCHMYIEIETEAHGQVHNCESSTSGLYMLP